MAERSIAPDCKSGGYMPTGVQIPPRAQDVTDRKSMNDFEKWIMGFSTTMKDVDQRSVERLFGAYRKIPKELRNRQKLFQVLEKENPHIFSTTIAAPKSINLDEQNMNKRKILDEGKGDWQWLRKMIPVSLKNGLIGEITYNTRQLFPTKDYKHSSRIKDLKGLRENVEINNDWGRTDLFGLRIVPKRACFFPDMVGKFEKEFGNDIVFKLNFFSNREKKVTRIRKIPDYYCAINYYFPIRPFFMEVQVRTPGIDLWSCLAHDTIYKNKIKVSPLMKRHIIRFGEMCNIEDFFEITSCEKT